MYELNQVVNGMTKYFDNEIIPNVTGWQKWVLGAGYGMTMSKATNYFNVIKEHPFIKTLEIVDKDNKINVDELHKELLKQADKGAITFDLPMIGSITLKKDDVDKLYGYIKG